MVLGSIPDARRPGGIEEVEGPAPGVEGRWEVEVEGREDRMGLEVGLDIAFGRVGARGLYMALDLPFA